MPDPEAMKKHLKDLQTEYEEGVEQLKILETRVIDLRQTLLRLKGEIESIHQVLDNEKTQRLPKFNP